MAEKPKTYPQQIQELKQQLEDALTDKVNAERQASFIPELQQEIADLKALVSQHEHVARQTGSTNKAQWTDLEQRAISAEQGLKNAQAASIQLRLEKEQLESTLDLVGAQRDKAMGLERKLELVTEELKTANLRIASLNQQLRDKEAQAQASFDAVTNELRNLRVYNQSLTKFVNEIRATIQQAPDVLAQLRNVVGL